MSISVDGGVLVAGDGQRREPATRRAHSSWKPVFAIANCSVSAR